MLVRAAVTGLVLGGADCVWDDLRAYGSHAGIVLAVNDIGAVYPHRIDHWCSLHPEKLPEWMEERRRRGGNMDFVTWTGSHKAGQADRDIAGWTNGSSGLLAVGVAFTLGCDRVVLCGVPMGPSGHFFDPEPWQGYAAHRPHWVEREGVLRGRVTSMSGWTRELLGAPESLQEAA